MHKTRRLGRSWKIVIEQLHAIRKHNLNTHLILVVLSASRKVVSCALRGRYIHSVTHTGKRGEKSLNNVFFPYQITDKFQQEVLQMMLLTNKEGRGNILLGIKSKR